MSNYRDDTQETAVISASLSMRVKTVVSDTVRASAAIISMIFASYTATAAASDSVHDRKYQAETATAAISDSATGIKRSKETASDRMKIADKQLYQVSDSHTEKARISASVSDRYIVVSRSGLKASDSAITNRTSKDIASDSMRVFDGFLSLKSDVLTDTLSVSDKLTGKAVTRSAVTSSGKVSDSLSEISSKLIATTEKAKVVSSTVGRLVASDNINDSAKTSDSMVADYASAPASHIWTANNAIWGMSRYDNIKHQRIAVIDGKLYAETVDGVYLMEERAERLTATVTTGKLDMGDILSHPTNSYIEYETDGSAEMTVHTTQSGKEFKYAYRLPKEQSGYLTNGRFTFGRGLRGRHFSFALKMTAKHYHVADLSIDTTQTRRRV